MRRSTHCELLLERLADGAWHTSYELTHELGIMVHSRISDLRKRGHVIDREKVPGQTGLRAYRYRWIGKTQDCAPAAPSAEGETAHENAHTVEDETPTAPASSTHDEPQPEPAVASTAASKPSALRRSIDEIVALLTRSGWVDVDADDLAWLTGDEQLTLEVA